MQKEDIIEAIKRLQEHGIYYLQKEDVEALETLIDFTTEVLGKQKKRNIIKIDKEKFKSAIEALEGSIKNSQDKYLEIQKKSNEAWSKGYKGAWMTYCLKMTTMEVDLVQEREILAFMQELSEKSELDAVKELSAILAECKEAYLTGDTEKSSKLEARANVLRGMMRKF